MPTNNPARANIARWLDRLQPSESIVLGGAALLVGLTSGMGVWLFKRLIDLAHLGHWTIALVPVVGGPRVGLQLYLISDQYIRRAVARFRRGVLPKRGVLPRVLRQCLSSLRWQILPLDL